MRFQEVNTCKECMEHSASCQGNNICKPARQRLRSYNGIRFTSDGFDCAFPVSIDSHSVCSFGCLYCFAANIMQCRGKTAKPIGQTNLGKVERIFSGEDQTDTARWIRQALKYNDRNDNGYPCAIQLGALTDPMDNIERQQGWFLKFAEIIKKYEQPVKISTKGNLFLEKEYIDAVADRPDLFYITYSIITPDDKIIKQIEPRAPTASERIQCISNLSDVGVKTALRLRPMIPGVSDSTEDYPEAYKKLIKKCANAGIESISYEVAFTPGRMTEDLEERWGRIEHIINKPIINLYKSFGTNQACMRPSHIWTEQIMHAVYHEAKKYNLLVGVSDPCWKQLTETGCCCGISEDDPIFGNWQKESATNQLKLAKEKGKVLCSKDIIPEWAYQVPLDKLVNPGVGPKVRFKRKHQTWSDKLKEVWNDISKERGPLQYFQGALIPVKKDEDGEIHYKYQGLDRKHPEKTLWWKT